MLISFVIVVTFFWGTLVLSMYSLVHQTVVKGARTRTENKAVRMPVIAEMIAPKMGTKLKGMRIIVLTIAIPTPIAKRTNHIKKT